VTDNVTALVRHQKQLQRVTRTPQPRRTSRNAGDRVDPCSQSQTICLGGRPPRRAGVSAAGQVICNAIQAQAGRRVRVRGRSATPGRSRSSTTRRSRGASTVKHEASLGGGDPRPLSSGPATVLGTRARASRADELLNVRGRTLGTDARRYEARIDRLYGARAPQGIEPV
jgi:hypothetical protein